MNALLLALTLIGQVPAEAAPTGKPTLTLPAQVQALPGKVFIVKAETNLKWVRWTLPPGLERVPVELTADGTKAFVGYGPAGVYEFKVEGTLNDQFIDGKCVVFVGQPLPPPPGPTPPTPPQPADPLYADLQRLYLSEKATGRADSRNALAGVYRYGADLVAGRKGAKVTTLGELFEGLRKASEFALPADVPLTALRQRLAEEHAKLFPGSPAVQLDDQLRKRTEDYFLRLAKLIEALN